MKYEFTLKDILVTQEINNVINSYLENPSIIYDVASIRKIVKNNFPKFRVQNKCIFRGCENKSIRNSHGIQEASLRFIKDASGHLLTTKIYEGDDINKIGKPYADKIGVGDATTFPGFCEEIHEDIFDYEKKVKLTKNTHYLKQTYRTICFILRKQEHLLNIFETQRKNLIEHRNAKLLAFLKRSPVITDSIAQKLENIHFPVTDSFEKDVNDNIKTTKEKIAVIKKLFDAFSDEIENKPSDLVYLQVACIEKITLPVALCGIWTITMDSQELDIIVNVIPEKNASKLIVSGLSIQKDIESFLTMYNDSGGYLALINFIEACMVFGITEWYIQPSVWNRIDENIKSEILNDIDSVEHGHEYKYSIFNEIRLHLINNIKLEIQDNKLIKEIELQKLNDLILKEEMKLKRNYST